MAKLDVFTGSLLVGAILSAILFGVFTVQVCLYFTHFPHDPISLKRMVTLLIILDIAHQVCVSHTIYHYTMSFSDPKAIGRVIWSAPTFHTLEVSPASIPNQPTLALVTHLFFARRLHLLNRVGWPVVLATVVLAVISFAFCIISAAIVFASGKWGNGSKCNWIVTTWLASGATCDILIAGAITYSLHLSRSGFKATDRIIHKRIVWAVATGAIPAFVATLQLACFLALPNTALSVGFDEVLAKLYTNSVLAFLNRRTSAVTHRRCTATQEDLRLSTISNLPDPNPDPDHATVPVPTTAHGTISNPRSAPRARSKLISWPKHLSTRAVDKENSSGMN